MKKVPAGTSFTTNHIHFFEGSPVNKSVKYQNRGTMGVQIPFSFPKILDFKPFQTKARFLPWQTNITLIFPIIPLFSSLSGFFTFHRITPFMAYLCISSHIFVSIFGKFFGKFKAFTKAKSEYPTKLKTLIFGGSSINI